MVSELIEAISTAINSEFGSNAVIYTEAVEQGMETPCFFVSTLEVSRTHYPGGRYLLENPLCVQYIPADPLNAKAECHAAADKLFDCLEVIDESGDYVRGTGMHCEVSNGVLSFFVSYDLFAREEEDVDTMDTLTQETEVEG